MNRTPTSPVPTIPDSQFRRGVESRVDLYRKPLEEILRQLGSMDDTPEGTEARQILLRRIESHVQAAGSIQKMKPLLIKK